MNVNLLSTRASRAWFAPSLTLLILLFLGCSEGFVDGSHQTGAPLSAPPPPTPPPVPTVPAPLPDSSTTASVGTIPGRFSVSNGGAAVYSMPIEVPPGPSGMQPALTLAYDSNAGNGVFGVGFSMSGLSTITRCAKSVLYDGKHGSVSLTENDRFCLDGQRLILVSGEYGADGAEYRLEVDSFTKIVSYVDRKAEGPARFRAWFKDGRISDYGDCAHSTACTKGIRVADGSNQLVNKSWSVSTVADRFDNTIKYIYRQDTNVDLHTLAQYIDEIDYGRGLKGEPTRRVKFSYESRGNDQRAGFSLGSSYLVQSRVREITTYAHDSVVRRYQLAYEAYDASHPRTKLSSVQECTGGTACKPATYFTWQYEIPRLDRADNLKMPMHLSIEDGPYTVADLDGDGFDDIVQSGSQGWHLYHPLFGTTEELQDPGHGPDAQRVMVDDYDLKGGTDLLEPPVHTSTGAILWDRVSFTSVLNSNPVAPTSTLHRESTTETLATFKYWDETYATARAFNPAFGKYLADLDGDGVRDLVSCNQLVEDDPNSMSWEIRLFDAGLGRFNPAPIPILSLTNANIPCTVSVLAFDADGDGADDLFVEPDATGNVTDSKPFRHIRLTEGQLQDEVSLTLHNSCPFKESTSSSLKASPPFADYRVLDFDGDGLKDIVRGPCRYLADETGFAIVPAPPTHDFPDFIQSTSGVTHVFQNTGVAFQENPSASVFTVDRPIPVTVGEFARARVITLRTDGRDAMMLPNHRPDIFQNPSDSNGDTIVDPNLQNAPDHWVIIHWNGNLPPDVDEPSPAIPVKWVVPNDLGEAYLPWTSALARTGDFNGDGLQDFIDIERKVEHEPLALVWYAHAGKREHIIQIRDGLHGHTSDGPVLNQYTPTVNIAYSPLPKMKLTGSYFGDPEEVCTYPVSCRIGTRDVVESHSTDAGVSHTVDGGDDGVTDIAVRQYIHQYGGLRTHRLGRGTLGFSWHEVMSDPGSYTYHDGGPNGPLVIVNEDFGRRIHERTTFGVGVPGSSSRFLSASLPVEVLQYWSWNGTKHVTYTKNKWQEIKTSADEASEETWFPSLSSSHVRTWELSDATDISHPDSITTTPLTEVTSTIDMMDEYGNVKQQTRASSDKHTTVTNSDYLNDASTWALGLVKRVSVVDSTPDESAEKTTTVSYDDPKKRVPTGRVENVQDPDRALTSTLGYDLHGNLTTVTLSGKTVGQTIETRVISRTFDAEGLYPISMIDPLGYTYQERHRDADGALVTTVDPNAIVMQWSYDGFGRNVLEQRPDSTQTTQSYGLLSPLGSTTPRRAIHHTVSSTGATPVTSEMDRLGRTRRLFSNAANGDFTVETNVFDTGGLGSVVKTYLRAKFNDLAPYSVEKTIDPLGRPETIYQPGGRITKVSRKGLTVATTDPRNGTSTTSFDASGRITRTEDALKHPTTFTYGAMGRLSKVTDSANHTTYTYYDLSGDVSHVDEPDTGAHTFVSDAFGQLRTETEGARPPTTYFYDKLGRVTSRTDAQGSATFVFDTAVHGVGQLDYDLTSLNSIKNQYTYDTMGRTTSTAKTIDGHVYTTGLSYDGLSRVKRITYPEGGLTVENTYDGDGRLNAVTRVPGTGQTATVYWSRQSTDINEHIVSESFGNLVTTTRTYAPDTQMLRTIQSRTRKDWIQNLSYEFDENLNLASRADALQATPVVERFTYDPLNRLCDATVAPGAAPAPGSGLKRPIADCEASDKSPASAKYLYDALGNIVRKPGHGNYKYDPVRPHAVTTTDIASFAYDDVGDQFQRPEGTVEYTPFHLPKKITATSQTTTFLYDAQDTRAVKVNVTASSTTHYVGGLFEKKFSPGATELRYTVMGAERPVAMVSQKQVPLAATVETTRYLHVDHHGSSDVVTDEIANASTLERRSYDAFGAPRNTNWQSSVAPAKAKLPEYGYTGQEDDDDLGLTNMRGRMYDPKLGRFLTADRIVPGPLFSQAHNRYSYVFNNPLTLTDPSGFAPSGFTSLWTDIPATNGVPRDITFDADPIVSKANKEPGTFEGDTTRPVEPPQEQPHLVEPPAPQLDPALQALPYQGWMPAQNPTFPIPGAYQPQWFEDNIAEPLGMSLIKDRNKWLLGVGMVTLGIEVGLVAPQLLPLGIVGGGAVGGSGGATVAGGAGVTAAGGAGVTEATVASGAIVKGGEAVAEKAPQLAAGVRAFASYAQLQRHFVKHSAEWGAGNITELGYLKRAEALLRSPVGQNILGFMTKQGWTFRYNSVTNEFATMKPDGTIETLFRPLEGLTYWLEQVKKYGQ